MAGLPLLTHHFCYVAGVLGRVTPRPMERYRAGQSDVVQVPCHPAAFDYGLGWLTC